ncbi:MAG: FAD-dependent oxidoreductase [Deltaproteobacteria bacterium]|nr:FAD-dependent oxidoreductase [Deltaproteobacteria bacterium]
MPASCPDGPCPAKAAAAGGASRIPVAIVGAGLTGMSAAFHLARAGIPCRVFEREPQPGGHVVTVEERGYRFDRTGHLLHMPGGPERDLALSWIGPSWREIERRSAIWSHGVYTRYPFQANLFGLPPAVAYECLQGFVDAHVAPPQAPARNFEEFCLAHFGRGITERFMVPYNTRLWGVGPTEMTADWCARFVPVPTLGDVLAGAVGFANRELGYNARFIYPERGIGQLSSGLAAALGSVECSRPLRRIDSAARELAFDGERVRFEVLVSTIPLPRLVELWDGASAPVRRAAARLRATHLYYLDVALRTPCGRPYHWIYVPEPRYPFHRVGCYSHFSAQMAPPGTAGLYVELSDRQEPDLASLLPAVADGLCEMGLIARREAILFARARRLDPAYVVFDHACRGAIDSIRPFLAAQRILSCGRYGGWDYSSMADALASGREAAAQAAALLGGAQDQDGDAT